MTLRMRFVAGFCSSTLCITASGCSDPAGRELPPVSWEGEHLRLATNVETPLCGGTAPYMDHLLGALGEQLGAAPPGRPIYYLLEGDVDEYDTPCGAGDYSCGHGTAAYSPIAPFDHEIVHVARSAIGFSYPLIEEGAAEYWGDDADIRGRLQGDVLELAAQGNAFEFPFYPKAGHFVAYLLDVYGEESFLELSRRTNYQSSLAAFDDALVAVYGEDLEALAEDYEANYPKCSQRQYRAAFGECTFTPARSLCESDEPLVVRRRFSCGDEDVLGPRFGRQWTTIPIDLPSAGLVFLFQADLVEGVELTIRRCGGGCPPSAVGPLEPSETTRIAPLDEGRYVIEIEWPEGQEIEVDLEIYSSCA
ncbi:gluzincin family metallopeptidase [Paraliomyxa miuraensis]|uniref:hypothetical protein n=1 Tax=Paraliomyxa miuraensis TaxID=376150 RepID=UPI00225021DB|nr:hypothetical protein [Paraliomyxa miuraensis]MCX4244378.1 hypothetical protein [Paraliomyxa miuraensis]